MTYPEYKDELSRKFVDEAMADGTKDFIERAAKRLDRSLFEMRNVIRGKRCSECKLFVDDGDGYGSCDGYCVWHRSSAACLNGFTW